MWNLRIVQNKWCSVVALACEDPEASGVLTSHWTPKELAREAVHREVVKGISSRSVERFIKRSHPATSDPRRLAIETVTGSTPTQMVQRSSPAKLSRSV